MGSYLSAPIKVKEFEEGSNERLKYACTSMQGWRIHQEDSHNCIINYINNECSFFGVYDGHGGAEVAQYIALKFPDFLEKNGLFTNDDIVTTLDKCFVEFDSTLCKDDTIEALYKLKEKLNPTTQQTIEEEKQNLFEEAVALSQEADVGLDTIIRQYTEIAREMQQKQSSSDGKAEKRFLAEPSSRLVKRRKIQRENNNKAKNFENTETQDKNGLKDEINTIFSTKQENNDSEKSQNDLKHDTTHATEEKAISNEKLDVSEHSERLPEDIKSTNTVEANADVVSGEDDDDEDYIDDMAVESSEDEIDQDYKNPSFYGRDQPGVDSGATACIALYYKNSLIVANCGDSRTVLSRNGEAINLSVDHKPDSVSEKTRIEKAGGTISDEGRVNGGLNLSRAIGDHYYKQNTRFPLEEQMITARPDVIVTELNEKDDFFVVACDGIWNSMTSQEVVDFINERISTKTLKEIGSEICDFCCAPDTSGDGTGCDNMTIIIVDLKKREISDKKTKTSNSTSDST